MALKKQISVEPASNDVADNEPPQVIDPQSNAVVARQAEPKAETHRGVQGLLAGIFSQLEAAQEEADERVNKLKEELAIAERDAQAISVLLQIRKGNLPTSFSPADHKRAAPRVKQLATDRAPRGASGELQKKILSVLNHDGMAPAAILEALMVKGNKQEEARVRQALLAGKSTGLIGYHADQRLYFKP